MSNGKDTVGITDQNLMVCVRIRPMNEDEIDQNIPLIAHSLEGNVVVLLDPMEDPDDVLRANRSRERHFVFDNVFNSSCSQDDVFSFSTLPLISQVVDGYTATVFAYGATGTGKTYTMLGCYEQPGIMVKALENLFSRMVKLDDDYLFQVSISYLEVYNEMIRDLLNPSSAMLDLREDQNGVQVAGLTDIEVTTTDEVIDLLNRGNALRSVEATAANKHSSRSHAILQVSVASRPRIRNVIEQISKGKLFLIDLAGSERAANTLNRGKRMTEGAHINRSLLALGNCINALADPNTKKYINYRDSKLTRLLKDALGGNCRTVMIAHVSPTAPHFDDSRNTLIYADRAKHIRTKVHKKFYDVNFHLLQYNSIISELKQEINRLRNKLDSIQSPLEVDDNLNSMSMNDQVEEMKLKDQLLVAFQKHVDCKKSISENLTNDMDLSLEETRCQVIIKEWESRKAERIPEREKKSSLKDNQDEEKRLEYEGLDLLGESENVKTAKIELRIAEMERHKLLTQRQKLEQDLDVHVSKIAQLEKLISDRIKNARSKQTMDLLCRLHRLEIQQTDLRTENMILRQHSSRHEMVQAALLRHSNLCNQIILSQASLINSCADLDIPKDLEMLMDLYRRNNPMLVVNLNKDLLENDKYAGNTGRIVATEGDSTSDIRDITSNMSLHETNPEEKESSVSLPVVTNARNNTADTWDTESTHPISKSNTQRVQRYADDKIFPERRPAFEPQKSYSNSKVSGPNDRVKNTIFLPGIRGRQIIEPSSYKKDPRSKSLEPSGIMYPYGGRKTLLGKKLDPLGNVIYDFEPKLTSENSKSDKSVKLFNYQDNKGDKQTPRYRVPRSTQKKYQAEEKYLFQKLHRANEIKKLNERRILDAVEDIDSLSELHI